MITTGIPLATAASTGSTRARASSGASTIPSTPGGDRVLHELDLLDPIVFLLRTLPDHLDVAQLLGGLERAGVNRLPELVGRPLGDHDHPPLLRLGPREARPARVLDLRRMDQLGDLGIVHVLGSDQRLARRDLGLDRLLLEVLDQRLDAQLTHLERILDHQSLDLPLAQGVDQRLAGVEADEDDALTAGGLPAAGDAPRAPVVRARRNPPATPQRSRTQTPCQPRRAMNYLLESFRLIESEPHRKSPAIRRVKPVRVPELGCRE